MFRNAFIKLGRKECAAALEIINPLLDDSFDPSTITILGQDLSFYPGYRFLDITDYGMTPFLHKSVIYKLDHVVFLDGTNEPIYALNERGALYLAEKTVIEYTRFFFHYVQSSRGKFIIVETVDDISWREDPLLEIRKTLGTILQPMTMKKADEKDGYDLEACILVRESLIKVTVTVSKIGKPVLSNEKLLMDDLPVLDNIFGQ